MQIYCPNKYPNSEINLKIKQQNWVAITIKM